MKGKHLLEPDESDGILDTWSKSCARWRVKDTGLDCGSCPVAKQCQELFDLIVDKLSKARPVRQACRRRREGARG